MSKRNVAFRYHRTTATTQCATCLTLARSPGQAARLSAVAMYVGATGRENSTKHGRKPHGKLTRPEVDGRR